jgi:hypothetical protein
VSGLGERIGSLMSLGPVGGVASSLEDKELEDGCMKREKDGSGFSSLFSTWINGDGQTNLERKELTTLAAG